MQNLTLRDFRRMQEALWVFGIPKESIMHSDYVSLSRWLVTKVLEKQIDDERQEVSGSPS